MHDLENKKAVLVHFSDAIRQAISMHRLEKALLGHPQFSIYKVMVWNSPIGHLVMSIEALADSHTTHQTSTNCRGTHLGCRTLKSALLNSIKACF